MQPISRSVPAENLRGRDLSEICRELSAALAESLRPGGLGWRELVVSLRTPEGELRRAWRSGRLLDAADLPPHLHRLLGALLPAPARELAATLSGLEPLPLHQHTLFETTDPARRMRWERARAVIGERHPQALRPPVVSRREQVLAFFDPWRIR